MSEELKRKIKQTQKALLKMMNKTKVNSNRCLNCDCVADPYLEQFVALREQLVELQTDKVELIAQRDTWIGNADALRIELVEALALVYNYDNPSGFAVAQVCDDILDRTGALLGKVRDRARAMKRSD